jgi:hypothetical protein
MLTSGLIIYTSLLMWEKDIGYCYKGIMSESGIRIL